MHRADTSSHVQSIMPVLMHLQRNVHPRNWSRGVGVAGQTDRMTDENGWPPIDSDDGWATILSELRADLVRIDPGHTVRQVKEKAGVLEVWAEPSDPSLADAVHERIVAAQELSATTWKAMTTTSIHCVEFRCGLVAPSKRKTGNGITRCRSDADGVAGNYAARAAAIARSISDASTSVRRPNFTTVMSPRCRIRYKYSLETRRISAASSIVYSFGGVRAAALFSLMHRWSREVTTYSTQTVPAPSACRRTWTLTPRHAGTQPWTGRRPRSRHGDGPSPLTHG